MQRRESTPQFLLSVAGPPLGVDGGNLAGNHHRQRDACTRQLNTRPVDGNRDPQSGKFCATDAALEMCPLDGRVPPRAAFIQQLVASWKELQRRQKAKA